MLKNRDGTSAVPGVTIDIVVAVYKSGFKRGKIACKLDIKLRAGPPVHFDKQHQ